MLFLLQLVSFTLYMIMIFLLFIGLFAEPGQPSRAREKKIVLQRANNAEYQIKREMRSLRNHERLLLCFTKSKMIDPELHAMVHILERIYPYKIRIPVYDSSL